jgi:hypothetical protein
MTPELRGHYYLAGVVSKTSNSVTVTGRIGDRDALTPLTDSSDSGKNKYCGCDVDCSAHNEINDDLIFIFLESSADLIFHFAPTNAPCTVRLTNWRGSTANLKLGSR